MATFPAITVGAEAVDLTDGLTDGASYEAQVVTEGTLFLWDGAVAPDPLVYDTKRVHPQDATNGAFGLDVDAAEPTWAWCAPGYSVKVSISDA